MRSSVSGHSGISFSALEGPPLLPKRDQQDSESELTWPGVASGSLVPSSDPLLSTLPLLPLPSRLLLDSLLGPPLAIRQETHVCVHRVLSHLLYPSLWPWG